MEELDDLLDGSMDLVEDNQDPLFSEEDFNDLMPSDLGNDVAWKGRQDVGQFGYGDSQFDEGATLEQIQDGGLDERRANLQPWTDQAANAISQAVVGEIIGGTIEGFGYMLDVGSIFDLIRGEETDFGNFLTDFGQSIREDTEENMRIYQDPNAQGMDKAYDPGWWFSNSVSVASTVSMMMPSMAATRALSFIGKGIKASNKISKGLQATRKLAGLGKEMGAKGKWMADGLSQAVISRNIENWMEAHGTFEGLKQERLTQVNPKTGVNFTDEEATKDASEAAAENYRNGWAMLLQDIPQYLALGKVFNPVTRKMEGAISSAAKKGITGNMKPWQRKVAVGAGTFLSEGGEESYQFLISEKAKLSSDLKAGLISEKEYKQKIKDAFGSEEMNTSAFFGGLGGNVFQFAGKGVGQVFKSKDRKEYEKNIGQVYEAQIKRKATQISSMQQELARADQDGRASDRKEVIDNYMMHMVGESLENDKYEQFYETIEGMANMSEEDKANYTELTQGSEFSNELAKEYTPDILKRAEEMRNIYLKHRSKNSSAQVSSKLARLEVDNQRWAEKKSENTKKINKIKESISDSKTKKATDGLKSKWERTEDIHVTKGRIKDAQMRMDSYDSPEIKSHYQKIKIENENRLKVLEAKEVKENIAGKENKATQEEKNNNTEAQIAYDAVKADILSAKALDGAIDDQMTYNLHDMKYTQSPAGIKGFEKQKQKDTINALQIKEQVEEGIESVKNNEDFTEAEKETLTEGLNDKLATIKAKEKAAARAKIIKENADAEAARLADSQADPTTVTNQKKVPVGDNIEDANQDLEVDTNKAVTEKDTKAVEERVKGSRSVALLDKVRGTKTFQEWVENSARKIGQKFKYMVSNRPAYDPRAKQALKDFNEAVAGAIPQSVYDNLPVMAQLSSNSNVFTFLNPKPMPNASAKDHQRYQNNYAAQRKIIIDRLKAGESTEVEVKHTSGGELQMDPNPTPGFVAENSITDLVQMEGDVDNVFIMVTNIDGHLVDSAKNIDSEFRGYTMHAGLDKDGNKMPYRGGVFVKVRKADGTTFPLRVNFLKNTEEQASVLADLLMEIGVPTEVGGSTLGLDQYLEDASPALQQRIKESFGPELEMLAMDEDGTNPSIGDIMDTFVYASKDTAGLTSELYWEKGALSFDQGKQMTAENRSSPEVKAQLIAFLAHKKRRQLSLKFWESKPGYRKFVMDNKIINTNATINPETPLFKNTKKHDAKTGKSTGVAAKIFLEPMTSMAAEIPQDATPKQREILERMEKTKSLGMSMALDGHLEGINVATYYYPNSKTQVMEMASMEEALERYQKELDALSKTTTDGVKNTIGKSRTKDQSAAAAAKVVMPKKADVVKDPKVTAINKRRKAQVDKESKAATKKNPNSPGITTNRFNQINDKYDAEIAALNTKKKDPINDKDWNKFVDSGFVSKPEVQRIANKYKDGVTLSEREQAMFTSKVQEVNEYLEGLKRIDSGQLTDNEKAAGESTRSNLMQSVNNAIADRDSDPNSPFSWISDRDIKILFTEELAKLNDTLGLMRKKGLSQEKIDKQMLSIIRNSQVLRFAKGIGWTFMGLDRVQSSSERDASEVSDTKVSNKGKKDVPLKRTRLATSATFGKKGANPTATPADKPGIVKPLDNC